MTKTTTKHNKDVRDCTSRSNNGIDVILPPRRREASGDYDGARNAANAAGGDGEPPDDCGYATADEEERGDY